MSRAGELEAQSSKQQSSKFGGKKATLGALLLLG